MSRRASFFARQHPGQRRVRFPDEIIFDECVKDSDPEMVISMLRRVSLDIDVNRINMAGMTALHQVYPEYIDIKANHNFTYLVCRIFHLFLQKLDLCNYFDLLPIDKVMEKGKNHLPSNFSLRTVLH